MGRREWGAEDGTTSELRVLGIDEAGRGSVLGPLVVGGFCCPAERLDHLARAGVRDSKELSPEERSAVYSRLADLGECRSVDLAPRTIDRYVREGGLNRLELTAFAELVRAFRPDVAYVDACDTDAERFGRRLTTLARTSVRIVSRHKADRDFPVVGAASVVAKVRRDAALAALRTELAEPLGTGYPSDPETQACVTRYARDGGAVPDWMRRSWETVQRVKREHPARTLDAYGP
jgi:ribonuclease HII